MSEDPRSCGVTDEALFAFIDGASDPNLEAHVAECDECQDFLALVWRGELRRELRDPVLRLIRLESFLQELGKLGFDVAVAMGRAIATYGFGAGEVPPEADSGARPRLRPVDQAPTEDRSSS